MIARFVPSASRCFSLSLLVAAALTSGCSLEAPEQHALSVQIVPEKSAKPASKILSTPASINDLTCFGVNIRGGNAGNGPTCNGSLLAGITTSTASSRPATFDVLVPTGTATIFEAYGFKASLCPTLGAVFAGELTNDPLFNGRVYRLGSTTTDLTQDSKSVLIQASFDSNLNYDCTLPVTVAASISAGTNFACGVRSSGGNVHCWGEGTVGQLGNNSSASSGYPLTVVGAGGTGTLSAIDKITAGSSHACAKNTSGELYCWGLNSSGQLGINSTAGAGTAPAQVTGLGGSGTLSGVTAMAGGSLNTCAVNSSGSVFCWGSNSSGQLGINSTAGQSNFPVQVLGVGGTGTLSGISDISMGTAFACARSSTGNVYCWGSNSNGELGNNASTDSGQPVQVVGVGGTGTLSGITAITSSGGAYHTCALSSAGSVFCWGAGFNGQLGNNSTATVYSPIQVLGLGGTGTLSGITAIAGGESHTCAMGSAGEMYCWGYGFYGALGNNSTTTSLFPVQVVGVGGGGTLTIAQPEAGANHSCALDSSGHVYCWGRNLSGALGNNSTSDSSSPIQVFGVGGGGYLQL